MHSNMQGAMRIKVSCPITSAYGIDRCYTGIHHVFRHANPRVPTVVKATRHRLDHREAWSMRLMSTLCSEMTDVEREERHTIQT